MVPVLPRVVRDLELGRVEKFGELSPLRAATKHGAQVDFRGWRADSGGGCSGSVCGSRNGVSVRWDVACADGARLVGDREKGREDTRTLARMFCSTGPPCMGAVDAVDAARASEAKEAVAMRNGALVGGRFRTRAMASRLAASMSESCAEGRAGGASRRSARSCRRLGGLEGRGGST